MMKGYEGYNFVVQFLEARTESHLSNRQQTVHAICYANPRLRLGFA